MGSVGMLDVPSLSSTKRSGRSRQRQHPTKEVLSLDPCWIKVPVGPSLRIVALVFWASVQIELVGQAAVRTNGVVGE